MVLLLPQKHRTGKQNKLLRMRNTNLLDLLKTGLDEITLISEENWWQFFLHIVLRCLANEKNGKFMDILQCILWDFNKKSGYFLFLLSIFLGWQISDIHIISIVSSSHLYVESHICGNI